MSRYAQRIARLLSAMKLSPAEMCGRYDNLVARDAYRGLFKANRLPKSNFHSLHIAHEWRLKVSQIYCFVPHSFCAALAFQPSPCSEPNIAEGRRLLWHQPADFRKAASIAQVHLALVA
jgi:hypothetical protein